MTCGMNARIAEKGDKMNCASSNTKCGVKDFIDCALKFVIAFFFLAVLWVIARHLDITLTTFSQLSHAASNEDSVRQSISSIQNFIATVTGLLALIIGATGIGSYLSFKKIHEEETRIIRIREKSEALLKIIEIIYFDPLTATGSRSAIKSYSEAEKQCNDYAILYILRGEEYYYAKEYSAAISDFGKALSIDPTSSRAFFGLGQAQFRELTKYKNQNKCSRVWSYDFFKGNLRQLKMHKFEEQIPNHTEKKEEIDEAISSLNKSFKYGYDESRVEFEIGRIHDSKEETCTAIKKYKNSYKISEGKNMDAALFYCIAWVRRNFKIIQSVDDNEKDGVINTLLNISVSLQSKTVYALLLYIYCSINKEKLDKCSHVGTNIYCSVDYEELAKRAFTETNDNAINEFFYLETPTDDPAHA